MIEWRARLAARILWNGGVIAYPTEGVWGLGCIPGLASAVEHLNRLKKRRSDKGLIMVAADISQFSAHLVGLPRGVLERLARSWPGPITYLVPDNGTAPAWIVGDNNRVALRISDHPVVQRLSRVANSPLVSTSANPSRHKPAKSQIQVRKYFGNQLDLIVPGALGRLTRPTEIRDALSNDVVRGG